jgi:hypothetical protein
MTPGPDLWPDVLKIMDDIDWKQKEDSTEIRRPFTFKLEESVARAFIKTVKARGLFVRETIVKLMREFVKKHGDPNDLNPPKEGDSHGVLGKRD